MNNTCTGLGLLLFLSMLCALQAGAQQLAVVEIEPKTKLEAFQAQTGAVIIKGFSRIGIISASASVEVIAMELTDASTGKKQTGVAIGIKDSGSLDNPDRSLIDYDEVDSLLKGIDYISKATMEFTNFTKLDRFEATYKTKGYFKASTFSRPGKIDASVSFGYIKPNTVQITVQQLCEIRDLIAQAIQKLDSVK